MLSRYQIQCATGGVRIARYLDNRAVFPEGALAGKRVLELGAGCGLVSVVAAHLGARVLATDKDIVMEVLRDNLSTNGVLHDPDGGTEEGEERYPCGKVVVEELYWGPEASHPAAPFDIAIAAACLYMPKTVPLLLQTLHRLTRPDSLILLASILSKDTLARFCDEAPKWFEIEGRGDDGEVLGVFDGEGGPGEACGEGRRRLEPGEVATRVLVLKRKELRPGQDYGLPPAAAEEEEEREGAAGEEA